MQTTQILPCWRLCAPFDSGIPNISCTENQASCHNKTARRPTVQVQKCMKTRDTCTNTRHAVVDANAAKAYVYGHTFHSKPGLSECAFSIASITGWQKSILRMFLHTTTKTRGRNEPVHGGANCPNPDTRTDGSRYPRFDCL